METSSKLLHLKCCYCSEIYPCDLLFNVCTKCSKPVTCIYDYEGAKASLTKEALKKRPLNMWRYEELLPIKKKSSIATIGMTEGWTPLILSGNLGKYLNCPFTYIKDESRNPTFSFKARGLSVCVSRAYELGAKEVAIPSAGNAAGALSCYASVKGLKAHVFMPSDVDLPFQLECKMYGANVTLVDGLINDCGMKVREISPKNGWFEVSTLREPYRVEGKKTMAFEIVEQLDYEIPDVIIYPTGGGTGLIGMWKGFDELEKIGLIGSKRPRMVSVQSTGCFPVVKAFQEGKEFSEKWNNAHTVANGMRVPVVLGDFLILRALKESNGIAITVTDEEMMDGCVLMSKYEGIIGAPEGGACVAAQRKLMEDGWIKPNEKVVLFNTGSMFKYSNSFPKINL